jgi:hypothetical protein
MVPRDHSGRRVIIVRLEQYSVCIGAEPMPPQSESICILDDDASVRHSIEQLLDSDELTAQSFEEGES